MTAAVFSFRECAGAAAALAAALGIAVHEVKVRNFPDGESLVRAAPAAPISILYRSLDNPNAKLIELVLAASALRDNGARRLVLVVPYLAYMRQDKAFEPGEAVSQRVIGQWLASYFDMVVTLDPHLHRVHDLGQVMPGAEAVSLSAAPVLAQALAEMEDPVLAGPDSESRPWVEAIAHLRGLDVLVGEKRRDGDRDVSITIPGVEIVAGRNVVLVDDVISSGATLVAAAGLLVQAGASRVEALASHCLARAEDLEHMRAAGIERVTSTQSVNGPTARIPIADLLAAEIRSRGWLELVENMRQLSG